MMNYNCPGTFIASSAEAHLLVRSMDGACTAHIVSEYVFTDEKCEHSRYIFEDWQE
jgi:hypothetical protein